MGDPDREIERAQETMDDSIRRLERRSEELSEHIDQARRDLHQMRRATGSDGAGPDDAPDPEAPSPTRERE